MLQVESVNRFGALRCQLSLDHLLGDAFRLHFFLPFGDVLVEFCLHVFGDIHIRFLSRGSVGF